MAKKSLGYLGLIWILNSAAFAAELKPVVEVQEDVYTYTNADNGAGPMWCHGSTCLVRIGDQVFASGLETVPDAKPLNNCRWMVFQRRKEGWERVHVDADGRTREPAPLAGFADGRFFLSAYPTRNSSSNQLRRRHNEEWRDPKKKKRKFTTPKVPYDTEALMSELKLLGSYGLRNKRELWRIRTQLSTIRRRARDQLSLTIAE